MQSGTSVIVFTDMVGSTELLNQLGDVRAISLRRAHDRIAAEAIESFQGEIVDTSGDGVMAVFATCTSAVEAAMAMQQRVEKYGNSRDAIAKFQIRVGVAVGEVTVDAGDYFGEPVIEAARLEPLAGPGEVLVTDLVVLMAQRNSEITFESVGEFELKGLPRSVRVSRAVAPVLASALNLPRQLGVVQNFPFVGREHESEELARQWSAALESTGQLSLVTGEAGIGKSRLVAELAQRVHLEGAAVLYGACDRELMVPYRPFVTALRQASALDPDSADPAAALEGFTLNHAKSGLSENRSDADRLELFELVAETLGRVGAASPILLVIDDLQWAARETILLLRHLVLEAPELRLQMVCSFRDGDVGAGHPLHDFLAEVRELPTLVRVNLVGLTQANVVELLESRAGGELDDRARGLADRLHGETKGSPFFTGELLRHLAATGALVETDGIWSVAHDLERLPIPDSIRDVVAQRLSRLAGDAVILLSTAAVIGSNFDLHLLAAALGSSASQVLHTLEAAESAALVAESDEPGRYFFVHEIVRGALLDGLTGTRRSQTHAHVAEALETLPGDRVVELAYHWGRSATPGSDVKTIRYQLEAAALDERVLAWEGAADRYRQVIGLIEQDNGGDSAEFAETWLALGRSLRILGDPEYTAAMIEAGRIGRRVDRADILAEAAIGSTRAGLWFPVSDSPNPDIVDLCEDALLDLAPDDPLRIRVLSTLAVTLAFDADRERRADLVGEAARLAREIGDRLLLGAVLVAEFLALWDPQAFERQHEIVDELKLLARRTADPELQFLAGFFDARLLLEAGSVKASKVALAGLVTPIAETRSSFFQFLVERMQVGIEILECEPTAEDSANELLERSARTALDSKGAWMAHMGTLARSAGTYGDFVPSYDMFVEKVPGQTVWSYALARSLVAAGEDERASAILDDVPPARIDYLWISAMQMLAETAYALRRPELSKQAFDALLPHRGKLGVLASGTMTFELVTTSLGQAAAGSGDLATAEELFREAVTQADEIGAPYFSATSRSCLAAVLIARKDSSTAVEIGNLFDQVDGLAKTHSFQEEVAKIEEMRATVIARD
ncbi:MAG: AAA family ATPase [Actinobacteria bacterium]|nr:AAA family ATPase [Actinomycetota bacterium]